MKILVLLLSLSAVYYAQLDIKTFKNELPNDFFYYESFVEKTNHQLIDDLKLDYRLVYHKIMALSERYEKPVSKNKPVAEQNRYQKLKESLVYKHNVFLNSFLETYIKFGHAFREKTEYRINKFLKNRTGVKHEVGQVNAATDKEKEFAARYINPERFESGDDPQKIIDDFYKGLHKKLLKRVDDFSTFNARQDENFDFEIFKSVTLFTEYADKSDMAELIEKFYMKYYSAEDAVKYYMALGYANGYLSPYNQLTYDLDSKITSVNSAEAKSNVQLFLTGGIRFPIRESRGIFSYINANLNIGYELVPEYKENFQGYKNTTITSDQKVRNEYYILKSPEIESVSILTAGLDLSVPVFYFDRVFSVEVGVSGEFAYYSSSIKTLVNHLITIDNITYELNENYTIEESFSNQFFAVSPLLRILIPFSEQTGIDFTVSTVSSGLRFRYNLGY